MALTKEKKTEVLAEVEKLLQDSKLTVLASYRGTSVKSMQALRQSAQDSGTVVKVIKNRLFKKALENDARFKDVDQSILSGQLMYAFNSEDEVAPAQNLANFAKNEPQIKFVGALTYEGQLMSSEEVKTLASLPNKEQLRAQLAGTISAPLSGFVNVVAGNVRSILNVLAARAEQVGQ